MEGSDPYLEGESNDLLGVIGSQENSRFKLDCKLPRCPTLSGSQFPHL